MRKKNLEEFQKFMNLIYKEELAKEEIKFEPKILGFDIEASEFELGKG